MTVALAAGWITAVGITWIVYVWWKQQQRRRGQRRSQFAAADGDPLTVIIAVRNRSEELEYFLRMVRFHYGKEVRIGLCDLGSRDDTPQIMARAASQDPGVFTIGGLRSAAASSSLPSEISSTDQPVIWISLVEGTDLRHVLHLLHRLFH